MNKVSLNNPLSVPSTAGLLMLLTGILTPWVSSPLGASHRLFEIAFAGLEPGTFGTMLVTAALLYLLFLTLSLPRLALGVLLALLTLIVAFFVHVILSDHPWMVSFLTESDQRVNLQALFNGDYWPNINLEPTIVLIPDFEYLFDRVALCWSITAFGCSVSCAGIILLLVHSGFMLPKATALSSFFATLIVIAMVTRSPLVAADLEHRRGDSYLNQGLYVQAIESYQSAIELDPVLRYSRAFAAKSSHAFLKHDGPESLYARLGSASIYPLGQNRMSANIENAYAIYQDLSEADFQKSNSSLKQAILAHTNTEATRTLIKLGLIINNYDHPNSIEVLQKALTRSPNQPDTLVLLAHSEINLGLWDRAIPHLAQALGRIENNGVRANVFCTIGDAYQGKGELLRARKAYTQCAQIDQSMNYRGIRNLGGT